MKGRRVLSALSIGVLVACGAACSTTATEAAGHGASHHPAHHPSRHPSVSPTPRSSGSCLRAQRAALPELMRSWWQTGDNVNAGARGAATGIWNGAVQAYLGAASSGGCPKVPREAAVVVRTDPAVATGTPTARLTPADVHRMRAALLTLARSLHASPDVRRMANAPMSCPEMRRATTLSSHVVRTPAATGEHLALVIRVHNRSSRLLTGSTWGHLHVSEVIPGTPPALDWGGSGADDLWAKPRSTFVKTVAGVAWYHLDVPTTATITKLRVGAYLGYGYGDLEDEGDPLQCDLPVVRR